MLPGQDEGAADFLVQTLALSHFPFSVSSFRPGNLNLFGALLQPHAPEKKENNPKIQNYAIIIFFSYGFLKKNAARSAEFFTNYN